MFLILASIQESSSGRDLLPKATVGHISPPGGQMTQQEVLSDDGRVIYAVARAKGSREGGQPWRWREGRGELLPMPRGVTLLNGLMQTTANGRFLVATVSTADGVRPCRWDDGRPTVLQGDARAQQIQAYDVAKDGTVVGTWQQEGRARSFVWNARGVEILPTPDGALGMTAKYVSADGRTIAGSLSWPKGAERSETWVRSGETTRLLQGARAGASRLEGLSADGSRLLVFRPAPPDKGDWQSWWGEAFLLTGEDEVAVTPPAEFRANGFRLQVDASGTLVLIETSRAKYYGGPCYLWTKERVVNLSEILEGLLPKDSYPIILAAVRPAKESAIVLGLDANGLFRAEIPL